MDDNALIEQLLADHAAVPRLITPLPDELAEAVVERLKQEADRHWWINANRSLELAELIVQIGRARNDLRQIALGTMARGDALKLLGRAEEAWTTLQEAGDLYQESGDEVGWARTRIGRLFICVDLNCVAEALDEAERARQIFARHKVLDKRLVLDLNTAAVHNYLGNHHQALELFWSALASAQDLGGAGEDWLVPLYTNIGFAYEALGNFRQALTYHERACTIAEARGETRSLAVAETNIAIIAMKQGHFRQALNLLHRAHDLYVAERLDRDETEVNRIIVECYLLLNRFTEARELARRVAAAFHESGESYEEALTLIELATAEAQLGRFTAARAALDDAELIFTALDATAWIATVRLRRGRIALQQGATEIARREADAAAGCFESSGQQVNTALAYLLHGQALLADRDVATAEQTGTTVLQIAKQCNVPALRYNAHLLLGHAAEAQAQPLRAARRYHAAAATVDRMQRGLTITLRPGFLEDKQEAIQALLALHLRSGHAARAFETLERAKSQVLLNYLTNREQLRWTSDDPRSRVLIAELDRLRAEHQWFYETAHDQLRSDDGRAPTINQQQALAEVARRERRMREITEQLYLSNDRSVAAGPTSIPAPADIRRSLSDDALLIEFYNDGQHLWAFTLDRQRIAVHPLPLPVTAVDQLLAQMQINLAAALKAGPDAPITRSLTGLAQRILQRLYAALIAPIKHALADRRRLIVVPYGALHYLPFHLLHDGAGYLIDCYEVVILPAASLALQQSPQRQRGARVLAHSWDGRLPQTLAEAQIVQQVFGGEIYSDQAATRSALEAPPSQVLHIAAHGEYRLDQPDLSYIRLADGQLYTDDLLQHDLSYELVTLSACETGRANVAAGDELIGLGRGFLYAGAGALLVSLWRIPDDTTIKLMEHVYRALHAGASKAAALGDAQRALYASEPQPHPAFWGAFQLVGDAGPLSPAANGR